MTSKCKHCGQPLFTNYLKWDSEGENKKFLFCDNSDCSHYFHALIKCPNGHSRKNLITKIMPGKMRVLCIKCAEGGDVFEEGVN